MKKLTTEEFIEKAKISHGNKYDYSLVDYKNNYTKITIICKYHGEFTIKPNKHSDRGDGCAKCTKRGLNTDEFINKAKSILGDRYDYSLVDYVDTYTKIKIICKEHGEFLQTPRSHLAGYSCLKCSGKNKKSNQEFINECVNIHGDKYDYSLSEYTGCFKKVKIICKRHGIFEQVSSVHLAGSGCPICKCSKGEIMIKKYLDNKDICYEQQKTFSDCKNKKELPFDFYLTNYNVCIEFNGEQHYKSVSIFGGYNGFITRQKLDKIKREYCLNNNIPLIIIKYNENVEEILNEKLLIPTNGFF